MCAYTLREGRVARGIGNLEICFYVAPSSCSSSITQRRSSNCLICLQAVAVHVMTSLDTRDIRAAAHGASFQMGRYNVIRFDIIRFRRAPMHQPLTLGYSDYSHLPLDRRAQIEAPLHVLAAAAARLHLPRGYPLAHEQARSPSAYMRVSLRPDQLRRAAIGFAVAASHGLATAHASVCASSRTTWHWRTRILLRVMCGRAARIQVSFLCSPGSL